MPTLNFGSVPRFFKNGWVGAFALTPTFSLREGGVGVGGAGAVDDAGSGGTGHNLRLFELLRAVECDCHVVSLLAMTEAVGMAIGPSTGSG